MTAIRRARTETFENTISGLLEKRAQLFHEAERIRDRLAEIKNDVGAIDRVLGTLDYQGDLYQSALRQTHAGDSRIGRFLIRRGEREEVRHGDCDWVAGRL